MPGVWIQLLLGIGLVGIIVWLAGRNGIASARLDVLKEEIKKEREEGIRVENIVRANAVLSGRSLRGRLHGITRKK